MHALKARLHPSRMIRVRRERDVLDRLCLIGCAADGEPIGVPLEILLVDLEQVRGDLPAFSRSVRATSAVAAPAVGVLREAYVPRPYGVLSVSPSWTRMSSGGMPSSCATICANVVSWP